MSKASRLKEVKASGCGPSKNPRKRSLSSSLITNYKYNDRDDPNLIKRARHDNYNFDKNKRIAWSLANVVCSASLLNDVPKKQKLTSIERSRIQTQFRRLVHDLSACIHINKDFEGLQFDGGSNGKTVWFSNNKLSNTGGSSEWHALLAIHQMITRVCEKTGYDFMLSGFEVDNMIANIHLLKFIDTNKMCQEIGLVRKCNFSGISMSFVTQHKNKPLKLTIVVFHTGAITILNARTEVHIREAIGYIRRKIFRFLSDTPTVPTSTSNRDDVPHMFSPDELHRRLSKLLDSTMETIFS